jgi:SnoaL-like domain
MTPPAGSSDAALHEVVDYVGVRRLQAAYADVVSRRAWPELEPLFVPGCEIVVDRRSGEPLVLAGAAALGAFVGAAIEHFEFFEFTILNSVVAIDRDAARGRVWMCELRQDAATGHWSNAYGVYHDDYTRAGDGWRFARRRYHSLARTGPATTVFSFPDIGASWP